jgi:hypothetical protein
LADRVKSNKEVYLFNVNCPSPSLVIKHLAVVLFKRLEAAYIKKLHLVGKIK